MKRKSFRILFFLRKGKLLKNGEAPICMRLTVDGRMCDILIKRSIAVEQWNQAKECAKWQSRNAEELNRRIESIRVKLYQIYRELEEMGKLITAERIKNIYEGKEETRQTLLQLFAEHNAQCKALIGKGFAPKTVMRFESTYRYVLEFMQGKYNISDIALNELVPAFVHDFEMFLKTVKSCAQNATNTRLKILKKLMRIALENDLIKKSPFVGYKFKYHETNPDFLTMEEIQRIASKKITIRCIEQVRDVFVFQCFTGLAFSDMAQLSAEHLVKGQNGDVWIRKTRQKTKNMCHIPLLPFSIELIEKYKEHPICLKTGKLFPVISNQKMNTYLKEIADICGIEKNMTTQTVCHYLAILKKICKIAFKEGISEKFHFAHYKLPKQTETTPKALSRESFEKIRNLDIPPKCPSTRFTRDLFLFACYTGTAYADVVRITKENLFTDEEGSLWLKYARKKTDFRARVKLLPEAITLIEKYRDENRDTLFPMQSAEMVKANMKGLRIMADIKESITYHSGRHSFASLITLEEGVPIETISRMLGHSNIQTTQIYARVTPKKLFEEMDRFIEATSDLNLVL